MRGLKDIDYVLAKLAFMRSERIWPNGLRYLWTDAFGLVLLVSLYEALKEQRFLDEAVQLVADVERVLGRQARHPHRRRARPRRPIFPLSRHVALCPCPCSGATSRPTGRRASPWRATSTAPFVVPGRGVIWKMKEDLSGPYPGYGFGALDAFDGYVSYRLLDEQAAGRRNRRDAGRSSTGPPAISSSPRISDSA